MPKQPKWKGTKELQLDPEYPQWQFKGDGVKEVTMRYSGPYEKCLASAPTPGQVPSGMAGMTVRVPVKVQRKLGGLGMLEFMASNAVDTTTPNYGSGDNPVPIYEIEWTQVSKPLESHTIYAEGGGQELDAADRNKIEEWKAESDAAQKAALYDGMSSEAKHLADRLIRGQDTYVVYSPVGRVTTIHGSKPATGRCGLIEAPPAEVTVADYEYLKTADRAVTQGKNWQRVQEWTGADEIDDDIYDAAEEP